MKSTMKKKESIFRDKCDCCKSFKVCKGYNGMILCDDCIIKMNENKTENKEIKELKNLKVSYSEMTIYDFIEEGE